MLPVAMILKKTDCMIKFVFFSTCFIFIALFIAAVVTVLFNTKYKSWGACFLWWALFPFLLPWYAKKQGVINHKWKSRLLALLSPLGLYIILMILLFIAFCISVDRNENGVPSETPYHTAFDLQKATGVEFPEVVQVDSVWHDDFWNNYVRVKFVPKKPLTKKFFKKLDRACKEDSCCWRKKEVDSCYYYDIYPERPLDRTKGSHRRLIDLDGKSVPDGDGDYVSVIVPFKGDTIIIEDGWIR